MKKYLKISVIIIGLIVFEVATFELGRILSGTPYLLSSNIDDSIPFIAEFIYPYIFWYLLLFIVPFSIYLTNKTMFYKYATALIITTFIGLAIFIAIPTTVVRPNIEVTNITTWLVNTIYTLDEPSLCCLPSMHCALCFLFMIYTICNKNYKIWGKIVISIFSLLIVASTILIKQHVLIDAILSLIITCTVALFVHKFNIHRYFEDKIEKIISKNQKH